MKDDPDIAAEKELAEQHSELFRGRFLDVELAYWTAIGNLNAIFMGAAAVLAAFTERVPPWCVLGIAAAAAGSIILVIINFKGRRAIYKDLGTDAPDAVWTSRDAFIRYEEAMREKKRAHIRQQDNTALREHACFGLAAISLAFLGIGMFLAST